MCPGPVSCVAWICRMSGLMSCHLSPLVSEGPGRGAGGRAQSLPEFGRSSVLSAPLTPLRLPSLHAARQAWLWYSPRTLLRDPSHAPMARRCSPLRTALWGAQLWLMDQLGSWGTRALGGLNVKGGRLPGSHLRRAQGARPTLEMGWAGA